MEHNRSAMSAVGHTTDIQSNDLPTHRYVCYVAWGCVIGGWHVLSMAAAT